MKLNADTQVKAIIADLHAKHGSDDEVSAVTQLTPKQVAALRSGRAAGSSKILNRLKHVLGMVSHSGGSATLYTDSRLEQL